MAEITSISTRVAAFISTYVTSVWQLDLLVHLKLCKRFVSAHEIADTLYLPPDVIEEGLKYWHKCGLLQRSEGASTTYKFDPIDRDLDGTVEQTAKIYSERRVAIINLIFSRPTRTNSAVSQPQQD